MSDFVLSYKLGGKNGDDTKALSDGQRLAIVDEMLVEHMGYYGSDVAPAIARDAAEVKPEDEKRDLRPVRQH
ncbi:hypothetical protein TruAng_000730 [Truncatella angustata]|nr:hypothetical protein TruAng_000730 [Truncatella angustata]